MNKIEAPKKERKLLKDIGKIAVFLAQELVLGLGKKYIGKVVDKVRFGKRKPMVVLICAICCTFNLFAQYPATGNKQRLGYQTTGDGLIYRGRASDTTALKPNVIANSYILLDTNQNVTYVYIKTKGGWKFNNADTVIISVDTTSLSNRINLKVNVSDTAAMLLPYATKIYADSSGRFYARQDYLAITSAVLTWSQSDTLITGNSTVLQVYRNGQILLPSQYTVNSKTQITIALASFKVGENYTVIFPRGGGAGQGGSTGSGTVTSIIAGTGLTGGTITTSGTIAADLNVLMELSDTSFLSNRINLKQNAISLTTTGTSGAATLVNSTLNIPQYTGGGGGAGTVTSVTAATTAGNPLSVTNINTTPAIDIQASSTSLNGYLSSTNFTTFNNKQNAISLTTTGTSGAATFSSNVLNIPQYSGGGTVTSVAFNTGTSGTDVGVTGSPITASGTITLNIPDADVNKRGLVTTGTQIIAGDKSFFGNTTFNGTARFNLTPNVPTRLAGLSGLNRLTNVRLGSGLLLTDSILSATATGTVTSVAFTTGTSGTDVGVTGSPITASGTITLNIPDASTTARGLVTAGVQTFAGQKVFNDIIGANDAINNQGGFLQRNVRITNNNHTVTDNDTWLNFNNNFSNITITLPSATLYNGRELHFRNVCAGSIVSSASNIIEGVTNGTPNTNILGAGNINVKWCTLVSDGNNWVKFQYN